MTSRELVKRTIEMENRNNRVSRHLWSLPWAEIHYPDDLEKIHIAFPDDIVYAPSKHTSWKGGGWFMKGEYVDEWGCVFENLQDGVIGEVRVPSLTDWNQVEDLKTPEKLLDIESEETNDFCRACDEFVIAPCVPRPFERLQWLRKTENFFVDLIESPQEVKSLLFKVHDFYLKELELWCRTEVDGIWFMDDWGAQSALLISPSLWREFFKPCYKDYVDMAHHYSKKAFFHSDGYISDIIPELIEIGVDAINCQIFCMGVEDLGKKFKGKITFWGEIDRQHLLPYASLKEIESAVRLVKESLYQNGGVIAQCEFGPGADPKNVYQVFRTWEEIVS